MSKGKGTKIDNHGVIPKSNRKGLEVEANSEISMYIQDKSSLFQRDIIRVLYLGPKRLLTNSKINLYYLTV